MGRRRGHRYYYFASFFLDPAVLRAVRVQSAQALAGLDRFFWSGVPDATELAAASSAGRQVGVGVTALSRAKAVPLGPTLRKAIVDLPSSTPLFLDSGAYGAESAGVDLDFHMVRGQPAWDFVFELYRTATKGRDRSVTFVVAPDVKGSQGKTFERLARYAPQLRRLDSQAQILVPLQPGRLSLTEQARAVDRILGTRWVPALAVAGPRYANYFSPRNLRDFVQSRRPALVHLLGAGPATARSRTDRLVPELRKAATAARVPLEVQSDSALTRGITRSIRAFREQLKKRYPIDDIEPFQTQAGVWSLPGGLVFDETEDWPIPFGELSPQELKRLSENLQVDPQEPGPSRLTQKERRAFRQNPVEFLSNPPRRLLDDPGFELYAQGLLYRWVYREFLDSLGSSALRAAAIRSAGLERIQGAPERPDPTIGLITCGKGKKGPAPARELYTGCLFRDARGYFEQRSLPYFILSARYGLVEPDQVLEEYDQQLPSALAERQEWAAGVLKQLRRRLGSLRGKSFEFHGGKKYLEPLSVMLTRAGARVATPVRGKSTGELRAFYKRARNMQ